MDGALKEIYNAYCAIEFDANRTWIDDDDDYIGMSLLQQYRKYVEEEIDPIWEDIVETRLDEKTLIQLFNTRPMFFHKFPSFEEDEDKDMIYSAPNSNQGSPISSDDDSYSDDSDDEFCNDFDDLSFNKTY